MKNNLSLRLLAIALAAAAGLWFVACSKDTTDTTDVNALVYAPSAKPQGATYGDWSIKWWKWALGIPYPTNPIFDTTGANAGLNQSGPVYFLAGYGAGPTTRNITIPQGKDLFFPIFNVIIDYPCPDTAWHPAPGQTVEQLLTSLSWVMDSVDVVALTLDGTTLNNPFNYRIKSNAFRFTGDPSLTTPFDACITGTEQDGWSDGYWVMLKALPKGQHTLHFNGAVTNWSWTQDVTYNIKVE